jgi:PAS domain S-box-containing protein
MNPIPGSAHHPARILIVDDELHNRQLMEVMLTPEGFLLLTAASGEEALAIVAQQPPDLILLDAIMPGMDGYEVVAKIKGNLATKNIPVIMVTALDDPKARMLGLNAGAEDFLTKPVNRSEVCVRVRNLLRLKAYGDYYDKYSQILEREVVERTKQADVLAAQAALLDLAPDAIVVRDMQSRILLWNSGAEVMYGWLSEDALGRNIYELLRTEFSEPTEEIESKLLLEGRWEGEAIHRKRDGTCLIVASRWALQRDVYGAPVRILTINNDITQRRQADSELRLLTERLSLATEVARLGVWEWDLASNMLTWDATMFDIYGLAPTIPIPYEQWSRAVHHEDLPAVEATLRKAIEEKGQGSAEYRITRMDGCVRNVSALHRVLPDECGNVSRLIGVNMDVTEHKVAEKALEQSRQVRFKDEFLSHVSHELRSPVTAIKQFTNILLGGMAGELNQEQREYQRIVLKNVQQLQSMIDDLLEVTRLESGKLNVEPERISVSDAVTDTIDTLQVTAHAKGVILSCDLPRDLPYAYADQTRLRQILIILLDNAIKFTPNGGAAKIQARELQQDPQFLLLEVSDTGCGIRPEATKRIFERLYQVSEHSQDSRKGLGLGLYICKELVTRQGGQIWVNSRPLKGTTFSFTLPVFSLNKSIAPLLKNYKWPAKSVALITVKVCFIDAWTSKESREECSREARTLVERCLLPELDVLLPKMISRADGERFFVAAFVDKEGAFMIANRIKEQFDRFSELKKTGLAVSVYYSMLEPFPPDSAASTRDIVTSMATRLEESIKSQVFSEAVHQ